MSGFSFPIEVDIRVWVIFLPFDSNVDINNGSNNLLKDGNIGEPLLNLVKFSGNDSMYHNLVKFSGNDFPCITMHPETCSMTLTNPEKVDC